MKELESVVAAKLPRSVEGGRHASKFEWDDTAADLDGVWSWGARRDWRGDTWDKLLQPHLKDCESKTWSELESERAGKDRRHKAYDLEAITTEAYKRLEELQLEDIDELFRFRLNGPGRFYGWRVHNLWMALWWDAEHRICPSHAKEGDKPRKRAAERKAARRRTR